MKTKEELNALKEEYETMNKKLAELSAEELEQVSGGHNMPPIHEDEKYVMSIWPKPVPITPEVSKKCLHKPCNFSGKDQCPYYSDDIGDCVF